jgi:hypothetical protein
MHEVIKKVIESRRYELKEMLTKIDTLWVQGSITEEQRNKLSEMARGNANMQNSLDLVAKMEEHEKRLAELEELVKNLAVNKEDTEDGETEEVKHDEYVAGKWYYAGDVIAFGGKVYECIAPEGQVCTWSPTEYPPYWEVVND